MRLLIDAEVSSKEEAAQLLAAMRAEKAGLKVLSARVNTSEVLQ